jgi:hypothetical protein
MSLDNPIVPIEPLKAEPPKRKRRWFQFSLRTVMIFTALVAVVCGWLGSKIERKREERDAVKAIEALGGVVIYDFQWVDYEFVSDAPPPGPAWLRSLLGDEFFGAVDFVALRSRPEAIDDSLESFKGLAQLRTLLLSETGVSDAGLAHLRGLTHLRRLSLNRTNVTDAGIVNLYGLAELESLELAHTKVTDAGVKDLQKALPNCNIYR